MEFDHEVTEPAQRMLEHQLSFALYSAANRVIRQHRPVLDEMGLTFPQYLVTLALLDQAPQPVGTLGARLDMDAGTITPLLKRLQAAGIVTRTRDLSDERRVLVDLTARGRALEDDIRNVSSRVESACTLSTVDLADLRFKLDRLSHPPPPPKEEGQT